ncbi:MAG: hypothetical protein CSA33_08415 [Desulfobulbus propionicus]|nr:MAG: hypothetical protein CSA33_08415 [Desulfobulbus propionicus]
MRANGNTWKLEAAKTLIRVIAPVFMEKKTFVLMDSWYMKRKLLCSSFKDTFIGIGQVRKDSSLYDLPTQTKKRLSPEIWEKVSDERVACMVEKRKEVFLYGKNTDLLTSTI